MKHATHRCERWLKYRERECGKRASHQVHETRWLCKACYQWHQSGKEVLFDTQPAPSPSQQWQERRRLANLGGLAESSRPSRVASTTQTAIAGISETVLAIVTSDSSAPGTR